MKALMYATDARKQKILDFKEVGYLKLTCYRENETSNLEIALHQSLTILTFILLLLSVNLYVKPNAKC